MLLANKFRVYHLPTRKSAVILALYILLLLKKNICFFKKSTKIIFYTITHLFIFQNFYEKRQNSLLLLKNQHCLPLPNLDDLVDCNYIFCLPMDMMLLHGSRLLVKGISEDV